MYQPPRTATDTDTKCCHVVMLSFFISYVNAIFYLLSFILSFVNRSCGRWGGDESSGGEGKALAAGEAVAEKMTAAARRLRSGTTATGEGRGKLFLPLLLLHYLWNKLTSYPFCCLFMIRQYGGRDGGIEVSSGGDGSGGGKAAVAEKNMTV